MKSDFLNIRNEFTNEVIRMYIPTNKSYQQNDCGRQFLPLNKYVYYPIIITTFLMTRYYYIVKLKICSSD